MADAPEKKQRTQRTEDASSSESDSSESADSKEAATPSRAPKEDWDTYIFNRYEELMDCNGRDETDESKVARWKANGWDPKTSPNTACGFIRQDGQSHYIKFLVMPSSEVDTLFEGTPLDPRDPKFLSESRNGNDVPEEFLRHMDTWGITVRFTELFQYNITRALSHEDIAGDW